jgi:hypothetical protein
MDANRGRIRTIETWREKLRGALSWVGTKIFLLVRTKKPQEALTSSEMAGLTAMSLSGGRRCQRAGIQAVAKAREPRHRDSVMLCRYVPVVALLLNSLDP